MLQFHFEVFADDLETMEKEAAILKQYGENVFVKIPIVNTKGESTIPLIKKLSADNVRLNVTAVYTIEQVKEITEAVTEGVPTYVSSICRTYCRYRRRSITINERGCKSYA